jgi:hypothetical protein
MGIEPHPFADGPVAALWLAFVDHFVAHSLEHRQSLQ